VFLADMARLGQEVLALTGAIRINYAIFGNLEPALHAHVLPRFVDEPDAMRTANPWATTGPSRDGLRPVGRRAARSPARAAATDAPFVINFRYLPGAPMVGAGAVRRAGKLPSMIQRWPGAAVAVVAMASLAAPPSTAQQVLSLQGRTGPVGLHGSSACQPCARGDAVTLSTTAASPRMLVEPRSGANGVALVAINECRCAVEFGVKTRGSDGSAHAGRAVVAPRSDRCCSKCRRRRERAKSASIYGYVIGDPAASHAPPGPYRAPFALAQSFTVSQAPPTRSPTGTPAAATRSTSRCPSVPPCTPLAKVSSSTWRTSFFRGGTTQEVRDEANFVQILHDDGTTRSTPTCSSIPCACVRGSGCSAASTSRTRATRAIRAGRTCTSPYCATPGCAASRCR